MKFWAKITVGIQTLIILFFATYSYIKANEASTFLNLLREQEALLVRAELEAEKQTEIAMSAQSAAQQSAAEAQLQVEQSRRAIEACENSK
ncbi:hypothetical protein [uncultured Imperialibacter sp.]|uniref:hypothetical protein n=1 Tax=uncultured Imperialibacter sp. TaxID=1672639 RepID=UPI0030DC5504|tara:strand:+ start:71661 stop:71933 length:273 start_codon:yes stop_codon:yes gene_type:complete